MWCSTALAQSPLDSVQFVPIAQGLDLPLYVTHSGDGSGRLFIVERTGRIRLHDGSRLLPTPFLDISDRVLTTARFGDERGLLGLAFHPRFRENGFFFAHYSGAGGRTVLSRFGLTADPNVADPASEVELFTEPQPFGNHNGGQLAFGPDGYLYMALGDGGSGGDPGNRAQSLGTPLGKILRLDVDQGAPARPAPGNPFIGNSTARGEIWSYGLRNAWRFSFDRETGEMWIADVGQRDVEEINLEPAGAGGRNYGWRRMEGTRCFNPGANCNDGSLILPVLEYGHSGGRCSVTGGYRYRGDGPSLSGRYLLGDFCTGEIWAALDTGAGWELGTPRDTPFRISSFGEDESGELYVVDLEGAVYRIVVPGPTPTLTSEGVVNAASFAGGRGVAPGSIVSIFADELAPSEGSAAAVPLPRTLNGLRIRIAGEDAALFFVSSAQANAQIPWQAAGAAARAMTAIRAGRESNSLEIPIAAAHPGLFSMDQSGSGQGAVLISGVGIAAPVGAFPGSRPARIGEFLEIYAAGLGAVDSPPPTGEAAIGAPATLAQPTVRIGVEPARVVFSGLAPGFVGVYQVNVQLVGDFPSGAAVPLTLFIDGIESNTVTVAIE